MRCPTTAKVQDAASVRESGGIVGFQRSDGRIVDVVYEARGGVEVAVWSGVLALEVGG